MPAAPEPALSTRTARALLLFSAPLLLLAGVIAVFVWTQGAGLNIRPAAPIETVQFERTILRPGQIELHLRNTSPEAITLAQININDAIWPYDVSPSRTIPRLGSATITLNYHWVEGEAYEIVIFSSNSIPFATSIPVAAETPTVSAATLWSFTLIGIYVGIIPVALGMFWLPALKNLGRRAMLFLMSATVGLLLYLGIDATAEALESGAALGGAFQGIGIVAIGIAGTVLLLDAIGRRPVQGALTDAGRRLSLATMVAVGIGLHNLGEGLAIGAAYAVGAAALGTFLVIGFILQNITEGLGIIVPISRDRPKLRTLALLGVIGGAPAIAGTWIGGLTYSQPFSVLFLAIGAGAVFQVAYQIGRQLIWKDAAANEMAFTTFGGVLAGMAILYLTGLAIK
ncbi:MAG TPA: metal transporter [Terriglobia bacterium]|nr:metal transporter [Terriglobia bacterium]